MMPLAPEIAFWLPFAVSALLAYPVFRLLIWAKARQTVSQHLPEHQKKQGTPTMGGLIFVPALAITFLIAQSWPAFLVTVGFGLIGFVDDYVVPRWMPGTRGLGWKQKLILQFLVAVPSAILVGVDRDWMWIGGVTLSIVLAGNAMNFTDGLDFLAGGVLLAMMPAFILSYGITEFLGYALTGALIPFLFLNAPPAKVFMGDVGSLPLGGLLGLALPSMFLQQPNLVAASIGVFFLSFVLLVELVPVPLQIASVKLRKGKRLFLRTPIHHAFEAKGWPETRIVAAFILVQMICTALCLTAFARGNA